MLQGSYAHTSTKLAKPLGLELCHSTSEDLSSLVYRHDVVNLKEAATPTQGNQSTLLELREGGKEMYGLEKHIQIQLLLLQYKPQK